MLVELVTDGRHRESADRLLDRIERPSPPVLTTAAHGIAEALNALRRFEARGVIAPAAALAAVDQLGRLAIEIDSTTPRRMRVWALRHVMSAYDAAYAAAAHELGVSLLTVDGRLIRACEARGIAARHLDELAA